MLLVLSFTSYIIFLYLVAFLFSSSYCFFFLTFSYLMSSCVFTVNFLLSMFIFSICVIFIIFVLFFIVFTHLSHQLLIFITLCFFFHLSCQSYCNPLRHILLSCLVTHLSLPLLISIPFLFSCCISFSSHGSVFHNLSSPSSFFFFTDLVLHHTSWPSSSRPSYPFLATKSRRPRPLLSLVADQK